MNNYSNWSSSKMGDVVNLAQGLAINKNTQHLIVNGDGLPLLRIKDLFENSYEILINTDGAPKQSIVNPEDILFTRTGQVGYVFIGRTGVLHNNCFKIIPKKNLIRGYIYWYLKQNNVIDYVQSLASGAAQPDLGHKAFKSLEIRYPSENIQQKISQTLFTFENLIKINESRINTLEQIAQLLYREWFVEFRYPGHERCKFVDSELGKIPEGWQIDKLRKYADISWGDTSVTKASYQETGYVAYSASGPDGYMEYFDYDRDGIVLSAIGAACGKTWFTKGKWSCIKNTIRFWSTNKSTGNEYLYLMSNNDSFWNKRGGAQPFISQTDIQNTKVIIPEISIGEQFTGLISPMFDLIHNIMQQNKQLTKMRDLLLPKLMSGEIDVSKLDIKVN